MTRFSNSLLTVGKNRWKEMSRAEYNSRERIESQQSPGCWREYPDLLKLRLGETAADITLFQ